MKGIILNISLMCPYLNFSFTHFTATLQGNYSENSDFVRVPSSPVPVPVPSPSPYRPPPSTVPRHVFFCPILINQIKNGTALCQKILFLIQVTFWR